MAKRDVVLVYDVDQWSSRINFNCCRGSKRGSFQKISEGISRLSSRSSRTIRGTMVTLSRITAAGAERRTTCRISNRIP